MKLKPHHVEDLILLLMVLGLAFAIYVLLFHPDWLMYFFTRRIHGMGIYA